MHHPTSARAILAPDSSHTSLGSVAAILIPLAAALASMPAWAAGCDALFASGFEAGEVAPAPLVCPSAKFNDTGITTCAGFPTGASVACGAGEPAGQDAHHGRDALAATGTLSKVGGGNAGFDFTKISNSGGVLPANALLGPGPGDWACTRDNVTGLVWEVKLNDPSHPRHGGYNYTWYEPTTPDGNPGDIGATNTCAMTLGAEPCNTTNYRARVNSVGLCGANDWRLADIVELTGLVHYGRAAPMIDSNYFPNTSGFAYWSGSPRVMVSFGGGFPASMYVQEGGTVSFSTRSNAFRVRLVRSPGVTP